MSELQTEKPEIQPAVMGDFAEICSVLDRANEYSVALSGLPGWRAMEHVYNGVRGNIEKGECWVIRNPDGAITSAISLSETSDIWGKTGTDGQALYFTKLIKDPALAQPGEGRILLGYAAAEAQRHRRPLLRCDTVTELQGLIDYYEKLGFENKGDFIYKSTGRPGVLLEASAAKIAKAAALDPS